MPEEKFIINGGKNLEGEVMISGAKNAAFPLLAAAILTDQDCCIYNLPLIEDVFRMIEILKAMGARIYWLWEGNLETEIKELTKHQIGEKPIGIKINTSNITQDKIYSNTTVDLVTKLRGSILFWGPLLARFGKLKTGRPGGCFIGARPVEAHLDVFRQFGFKINFDGEIYDIEFCGDKLEAKEIILDEFSVTATENAMLLASLIPGRTIIKCADVGYQIQELAAFLQKMGVKIEILPYHIISIEGQSNLSGVEHTLIPDPIEAGSFILTAATTKGRVDVKGVPVGFLELFLKKLKAFGVKYQILPYKDDLSIVRVEPSQELRATKIQGWIYPGVLPDLLSAIGVLATQAIGTTLLHDPLYEGRFKYLEELNRMGANIIFCDPHRVIIQGPTRLVGRTLKTVDLRGGMALIIAGLIAQGQTIINNIYQIDRGYENIDDKLKKIGADIVRVKSD